ncbi:MAG: tetratricopeptide repeat protein, partial [Chthoniobacterales bacterium]|nr:tetratricopeptide repeat protein [Chthoniobacterales bacterium]
MIMKNSSTPNHMGKFSLLIRVVFVALLCSVFATGCTKEAKKGRFLRSAERHFKAGAYDKAKIEYLNVLRLDQRNATAFARLGQIWFDEGAPLKAGWFLIKARELAPNYLENRLRLARVYHTIGKREDARKEVILVLEQDPANGEALMALAEMALTPEGIKVAEEALQKFSNKESVFYQLAAANVAMRKPDLPVAQSLIDRALALDPKSADAHHLKGILHLLQKDKKGAGEEFKMAAELSPPRSSLKISYADYAAQTGSRGEASAYLESLTSKTPDFLPAWTLRARIALSEKKYDETLALLENVFSRDPDSVDARLLQAKSLLAKKQTKKAIDVLDGLDRNHPGAPAIKFNLARAYLAEAKP